MELQGRGSHSTRQSVAGGARWHDQAFVWISRLMMDFGFGSFFEKFEEYFGRRASKLLMFVVGSGMAVFVLSFVATTIFAASSAMSEMISKVASGPLENIATLVLNVATVLVLALGAAAIVNAIRAKANYNKSEETADKLMWMYFNAYFGRDDEKAKSAVLLYKDSMELLHQLRGVVGDKEFADKIDKVAGQWDTLLKEQAILDEALTRRLPPAPEVKKPL